MSTMFGADADALDALASQMNDAAHWMISTQAKLGQSIHSSPWQGRNADRFRQAWDSDYRKSMASASTFLADACTALQQNATQQRTASQADGGAAGGGGGGDGSFFKDLVKTLETGVRVGAFGIGGLGGMVEMAGQAVVSVKGYVTAAGTEVAPYLRWRPGEADDMRALVGDASDLESLADKIKGLDVGFGVAGGLLGGVHQWLDDSGKPTDERVVRAVAVGGVDTAIGIGGGMVTTWAAGEIGAEIGVVGGPVGVVIGGVVGLGVGFVGTEIADHLAPHIADWAGDAYEGGKALVSSGVHEVKDAVQTGEHLISDGASLVSGGANLLKKGLSSLW